MYGVYRLIDTDEVDHSGNREMQKQLLPRLRRESQDRCGTKCVPSVVGPGDDLCRLGGGAA